MNDLVNDKAIIVINKIDLGYDNLNEQIKKYNPIYLSIKKEKNLDNLIIAIKEKLKNKFLNPEQTLITRERHRQV